MQKLITEQEQRRNQLSGQFLVGLAVVVVLLSIVRVFLANWLVESSETLRDLDRKITQQTTTNQSLAEELREKESLALIESKAKAAGYSPTTKLTFVTVEPGIALQTSGLPLLR